MNEKKRSGHWYYRRAGEEKGPYTVGMMRQYVLLGRLRADDEVSDDRVQWHPLHQEPALIPDILSQDVQSPGVNERLSAARRWADEREHAGASREGESERRGEKQVVSPAQRRSWFAGKTNKIESYRTLFVVAALFSILAALVYYWTPPARYTAVSCNAEMQAGVDLRYCHLVGEVFQGQDLREASFLSATLIETSFAGSDLRQTDFSYVTAMGGDFAATNLQHARLKGANLKRANFNNANLADADLSYADLLGADLQSVNLTGTNLEFAIWVDGRVCDTGSIGQCKAIDVNWGNVP